MPYPNQVARGGKSEHVGDNNRINMDTLKVGIRLLKPDVEDVGKQVGELMVLSCAQQLPHTIHNGQANTMAVTAFHLSVPAIVLSLQSNGGQDCHFSAVFIMEILVFAGVEVSTDLSS